MVEKIRSITPVKPEKKKDSDAKNESPNRGKLIQLPGLNNQEIGAKFISLIDEGFKNYALFQQTQNLAQFLSWTSEFKPKVESTIHSWIERAGGEAGKLLRSLSNKAHQWWYFLDHPNNTSDSF